MASQSDDSIGAQRQLKDEMSVNLVNAQSMLFTRLGRLHYDGDIKDLPSDWDWSESVSR